MPSQADSSVPSRSPVQQYLDRALGVLQKFGVVPTDAVPQELTKLLDEVKHVDEPKVMSIARTVGFMSSFNQLVRDHVENIDVGQRYLEISQMFDSIRSDSKRLIAQLDDGRLSFGEKVSNLWMRLNRGSPSDRFESIVGVYRDVSSDTKEQLLREQAIMNGYVDFRFALKEAEIAARELLALQATKLEQARRELGEAQQAIDTDQGDDAQRSRLQLARDVANQQFLREDRSWQLLKDVAENLAVGYDVGETLIAKLKQTHDVKDQVHRRSVTFFTTNEHVFTILGAVYTSQHGLHEATQAHEVMKEGVNRGLEDVAELGRELERAALGAGYGSTIRAESVEKLVRAITDYQVESLEMVAKLRRESEENAREVRRVVEDGKRRFQDTLAKFARGDVVPSA